MWRLVAALKVCAFREVANFSQACPIRGGPEKAWAWTHGKDCTVDTVVGFSAAFQFLMQSVRTLPVLDRACVPGGPCAVPFVASLPSQARFASEHRDAWLESEGVWP